jgi:hypothetical protein
MKKYYIYISMEFSKENVEKFWKLLNSSKSSEEARMADEYLRQFKVK